MTNYELYQGLHAVQYDLVELLHLLKDNKYKEKVSHLNDELKIVLKDLEKSTVTVDIEI